MSRWPLSPSLPRAALLAASAALGSACAAPPLPESGEDGSGEPSIRFVFPETGADVVLCPEILVVVDVENWELVDPEETDGVAEDGRGHWHLKENDAYVDFAVGEWITVTLDTSDDPNDPQPRVLEAVLASSDHNELDTAIYPAAQATAEFLVSPTDCEIGSSGAGS